MCLGSLARRARRISSVGLDEKSSGALKSVDDRWHALLDTVPDDFFLSEEALLEGEVSTGKGSSLYVALRVDEVNNRDMMRAFTLTWKNRHEEGAPTGSYEQFRSAIGQYVRMLVALRRKSASSIYDICLQGKLLECITDMSMVQAFIGHFRGFEKVTKIGLECAGLSFKCQGLRNLNSVV